MVKALATSALLALAAAGTAQAATVTWGATPTDVDANPSAASYDGTYHENVMGSQPSVRRSPFEHMAWEGTEPYSAITGSATFTFDRDQDELSFVWGSPDGYNRLDFYLRGVLVDSIPGHGTGVNLATAFATFADIGVAGRFDSVVFNSGSPAFELAGMTTAPVPLPAGGLLLLTALGAVGVARRRAAA